MHNRVRDKAKTSLWKAMNASFKSFDLALLRTGNHCRVGCKSGRDFQLAYVRMSLSENEEKLKAK